MDIIAETKNGEILTRDEYPTPDVNNLIFDISEDNGTATDSFARTYKIRHV